MEESPVGSVETVETVQLLGAISNVILTGTLIMLAYGLLYGAYRLYLHLGKRGDAPRGRLHLLILFPLALALGFLAKSLFL